MKTFLWTFAVIASNTVISAAITAIAFRKMYRIYFNRMTKVYQQIDELTNANNKK